jgi:hypothetical protein
MAALIFLRDDCVVFCLLPFAARDGTQNTQIRCSAESALRPCPQSRSLEFWLAACLCINGTGKCGIIQRSYRNSTTSFQRSRMRASPILNQSRKGSILRHHSSISSDIVTNQLNPLIPFSKSKVISFKYAYRVSSTMS